MLLVKSTLQLVSRLTYFKLYPKLSSNKQLAEQLLDFTDFLWEIDIQDFQFAKIFVLRWRETILPEAVDAKATRSLQNAIADEYLTSVKLIGNSLGTPQTEFFQIKQMIVLLMQYKKRFYEINFNKDRLHAFDVVLQNLSKEIITTFDEAISFCEAGALKPKTTIDDFSYVRSTYRTALLYFKKISLVV